MEKYSYSSSILSLDVHSGNNVARKLGLLTRKQNDGKAVAELDAKLRKLDQMIQYDFTFFGFLFEDLVYLK
jgi:hypothetical protein